MKTYPTRDAVQPLAEREWASPQGSVSNAFVARNEWSQASATIEVKISDSALRAHFHATQKVPHPAHEVTETRLSINVWTSVPRLCKKYGAHFALPSGLLQRPPAS